MIVDVHTHVFDPGLHFGDRLRSDLSRCRINTLAWGDVAAGHLESTRAADVAVVFGLQGAATGWNVPNDYVHQHVRQEPGRLIFFAAIDPGVPGFEAELERCHQDLGCQGVKIAPVYQGVHPLDPRYYHIFAYCQKNHLPVLTHMATTFASGTPLEYARPIHMDQVAIDFPELRIVLAHLGHPWEGETLAVIRRNAHLFTDVSALYYRPWQFYNSMRLAVEYRVTDKVLFGSDYPFTTTTDSLKGVRNLNAVIAGSGLPPIPDEALEGVIHADTLKLLGLTAPRGGTKA